MDVQSHKEMLFNHLDINKDKKICETDMFRIIKSIDSDEMNEMFMDDIITILKKMNQLRKENGKDNYVKLVRNRSDINA